MRSPTLRHAIPIALMIAAGAVACSTDNDSTTAPSSTSEDEAGVSTSQTTTAVISASIDQELLEEQVNTVVLPKEQGATMIAVVDDDGSIVHAVKGSDPDGQSPLPGSPFRIGSITKVFTSLLTLTLVDEGSLDLDAPATEYVDRVPVPDGVTVRDLLQHTSGIPNYTDMPGFVDAVSDDPERAWSPEETIAVIEGRQPHFEPGARFSYSNTNYLILGVLIEETTGRSYAEELRTRIIEPLGLRSTYLAAFEEGPAPFGAYASTSFSGPSAPIDFDYTSIATNAWAAGAIISSVEDLHVLLTALFAGEIISPDSLATMIENEEYGLGLANLGPGLHGHGGAIPGYQTFVVHAADTGMTAFFVVTNDSVRTPPPADPVLARMTQN